MKYGITPIIIHRVRLYCLLRDGTIVSSSHHFLFYLPQYLISLQGFSITMSDKGSYRITKHHLLHQDELDESGRSLDRFSQCIFNVFNVYHSHFIFVHKFRNFIQLIFTSGTRCIADATLIHRPIHLCKNMYWQTDIKFKAIYLHPWVCSFFAG